LGNVQLVCTVSGAPSSYSFSLSFFPSLCPCARRAGAPFQVNIEPLLLKFGVDLTITGHMHVYERIHPVNNGTVVQLPTGTPNVYTSPKAPMHVVVGTAGAMQVWDAHSGSADDLGVPLSLCVLSGFLL
jgi:hypothetical protein